MSRSSEVSLGEAPLTSEASPSGYEKPNVSTCVECASRGAGACVEVEPRHKTPVFSSVKRVFRLPKGRNILCKATPSEQDGLQREVVVDPAHGATSSGEVTRPRPEATVPVQTVAEVPRGPKVPDTETLQARVEVSEDHEPLRPSAPNICPDSQDSPGLCAIHPGITLGSPSRPAHRGQMTTGKWTDGRGERADA